MADERPGFEDTPFLPGGEYRVHDPKRPHPKPVSTSGPVTVEPPSDATVLFDGSSLEHWEAVDGGDLEWEIEAGELVVEPRSGDIRTKEPLGDCQLHVEWATPADPGDERYPGNSGVFLSDRYEIQILDTSERTIYADGYTGAIYGQHPPLVNACRPAGAWQSYDITWRDPRFADGRLQAPARTTVFHNGVAIHENTEPFGPTRYQEALDYTPHGPAPLRLQDHSDRVRFRNIWYRPLASDGQ